MKACGKGLTFLFLLLVISIAPSGTASAQSADQAAINRVLDQLEEAYVNENMGLLSSLISDSGFILLIKKPADPSMALVLNKAQLLDGTAKRWADEDFLEHKHVNRRIIIDGPIAKSISVMKEQTKARKKMESPIFHILAKEDTQWRLVFSASALGDE
ncbi:MAG: hypothetical protein C4520_17190 [Candidatus Abyssobacteria bacterium SURF_5]|uniref:Nuclear transport factor 2 family protein n=1 Tax=Abyssobacteria bacterium (strain SURF_5) TaxID=2093360 RepID=A0A3A4N5V5_ABYX5|nr:MAG: hypothetical protein C4520_17190 [Candidatus Abyssubacteria bacterium SURF_5]